MLDFQTLEQILKDWNYWENPVPPSIPREALSSLKTLESDLVYVIQGVRRCGKSTLLAQILAWRQLDPKHCFFINFEDPRFSGNLDHTLLDAVTAFAGEQVKDKKPLYFFFDEIQNIDGWEKWLHRKIERPDRAIFVVTGSNAALLSGDYSTALTGRHRRLELFPFNFAEYRQAKPQATFDSFLEEGGFPRALSVDDPADLLRQYFSDIVERDVRRHVAVRTPLVITQMVKAVFESLGSEVSQRALARTLGVTADTIGTYLAACEAAYLLLSCRYFTYSEKQRAARHRKFYPIDLGLRQAVITKAGKDRGKSLECVVFHHLRKKYGEVFYWRGEKEVDFVVMDGTDILPFQVSWEPPKDRHEKALEEFKENYPKAKDPEIVTRENVEVFLAG